MILGAVLMIGVAFTAGERMVVHRCVGSDGVPRYQDQPCRDDDDDQRLELDNPPATLAPVAAEPRVAAEPQTTVQAAPLAVAPEPMSWRCEVENGEVYYRHDACPSFLVEPIGLRNRAGAAWGGMQYLRVWAVEVPRRAACDEIRDRFRFGAERDQVASPYDKLSGKDLCR